MDDGKTTRRTVGISLNKQLQETLGGSKKRGRIPRSQEPWGFLQKRGAPVDMPLGIWNHRRDTAVAKESS